LALLYRIALIMVTLDTLPLIDASHPRSAFSLADCLEQLRVANKPVECIFI